MKIFISGGAGFIGSNLAKYHIGKKDEVIIYDNLSRKGTELNLTWLKKISKNKNFKFVNGDVRDLDSIKKYVKDSDIIYHMAAQVAVTSSLIDPILDFDINAKGTLNILEAFRTKSPNAIFIYASTNKVFGGLEDVKVVRKGKRYVINSPLYKKGINEDRNLNFHSPYGCSKGTGDQYVRDYGRVYGLRTIVFSNRAFRTRQFGNEDQGWVMHFVRMALTGSMISIYGDGAQVRDLLFVDDLINAYQMAIKKVKKGQGLVYNIGGGLKNSLSLLELLDILSKKIGKKIDYDFSNWREGDQKIYISDNSRKLRKNWVGNLRRIPAGESMN